MAYPKSRAITLHGDAIETVPEDWVRPGEGVHDRRAPSESAASVLQTAVDVGKAPAEAGKVLFRPFVGVAPRLYARAFRKDREYKDKVTGVLSIGDAEWGDTWSQHQVSYAKLESMITGGMPR